MTGPWSASDVQLARGVPLEKVLAHKGGRKPVLDAKAVKQLRALMADRSTRPADIAARFKISRSTLYNIVRTGAYHIRNWIVRLKMSRTVFLLRAASSGCRCERSCWS